MSKKKLLQDEGKLDDSAVQSNKMLRGGEEKAGAFSRLLFWWVNPLVNLAYRQPLVQENLWPVKTTSASSTLVQQFQEEWAAEMQKSKEKRSLTKAMLRVFRWQLLLTGASNLLQNAVLLVTPVLIRRFLQWLEDEEAAAWDGYLYALLMFLIGTVFNGLLYTHMIQASYTMGMDMRTVLNAIIYRKSLKLSNAARQTTSTGEVVTLMSNDAEKLQQAALTFHNIWITPLFLIAGITMLIQLIGPAAVAGILFLVLSIPIQGLIVSKKVGVFKKQMQSTDERIKLLNEILQGIKIVKFYAWEASFKERVAALRKLELVQIHKSAILSALNIGLLISTPVFMLLITFLIFFATGGNFEPDVVFTAVALFYIIRIPLFLLPMAIASVVSSLVSLKRMRDFLELDEISSQDRKRQNCTGTGKGYGEIEVHGASFKWAVDVAEEKAEKKKPKLRPKKTKKIAVAPMGKEEMEPNGNDPESSSDAMKVKKQWSLEVPSFKISEHEIMAVVGMVGSGKSSFVSALLGDMTKTAGEVYVNGSIAYVAQTAWIVNATVRQNILLERPFDEDKYERVIEACALSHDLEMLPAGDETEIGEKGINLSGGQKQRISLARAAYADADIYIFDDPLSAVDAHVGRHIFEKLILKRLSGKTRLLCTNQLHFVPQVDRILVLSNGHITENGTYQDLMASKGEFSVLMNAFEGTDDGEETKKEAPEDKDAHSDAKDKAGKQSASKGKNKLIKEEEKSIGSVKMSVFKTYAVEGTGSWVIPTVAIVIVILSQATYNVHEWWLSYWTEAYFDDPEEVSEHKYFYMFVYCGLGLTAVFLVFLRGLTFAVQCLASSRHLHEILTAGILRAPSSFFDTTPIGRILNRFTKDIENIDLVLPRVYPLFLMLGSQLVGMLITIIAVLPWFIIPIIPLVLVYYQIQKYYRPVSRDLQRLESISRSPIFAQFSETLIGVSTLRAYGMQDVFIAKNEKRIDESNKFYYVLHCCNRWLQLRLELLGGSVALLCSILLAASKSTNLITVNAGSAGLVMTYTLQVTGTLGMVVRLACETESRITAAERIKEYSKIESEPVEVVEDHRPPTQWPASGEIKMNNLSLRYRPGLDLVLHGVSVHIKGGDKVGIAGRTGSGKSSLMIALFRLVEPAQGNIFIDNIDICTIGVKDLRSALSIIPQDPVMFCGTLRENLDPFQKYDTKSIWEALRSSHLSEFVSSNGEKLGMEISEGGENISLGQRQLVCLARAILRRNKILVMDEATANIDMETDALIQETIRKEFKSCTVLTIAHRLHTIMDCDKILIMDAGKVGEFDTPANLLENKKSLLSSLVEETGSRTANKLKEIALLKEGSALEDVESVGSLPITPGPLA